jgi:transposase-like protein
MNKKSNQFSPEVRERAVRMVQELRSDYPSLWAAVQSITPKTGCIAETLQEEVKRTKVDTGQCAGTTTAEAQRIKDPEREVKELRRANEILKTASAFFCTSGARPPTQTINAYIDVHRDSFGVEPICKVLHIAPSRYWRHAARQRNPELWSQSGPSVMTL